MDECQKTEDSVETKSQRRNLILPCKSFFETLTIIGQKYEIATNNQTSQR